MSKPSETNYLPWLLGAGILYLIYRDNQSRSAAGGVNTNAASDLYGSKFFGSAIDPSPGSNGLPVRAGVVYTPSLQPSSMTLNGLPLVIATSMSDFNSHSSLLSDIGITMQGFPVRENDSIVFGPLQGGNYVVNLMRTQDRLYRLVDKSQKQVGWIYLVANDQAATHMWSNYPMSQRGFRTAVSNSISALRSTAFNA